MINGYNLRKINGKKVLCLYLDMSCEFANLNNRNKSLKKKIRKYIKDNNINFSGGIVMLLVGGFLVGNIYFNEIKNKDTKISTNSIVEIMDLESSSENVKETNVEVNKNNEELSIVDNSSSETINKEEVAKEQVKVEVKKQEDVVSDKSDNNTNNEIVSDKFVSVRRKDGSIINLDLEEYVIGVVGAEMPASFNIEALKAQSVVARTYALKRIKNNQVLTDDNSTQNYKDNNQLKSMWGSSYNTYYNKVKDAVYSTRGKSIVYNNDYIDALYHSTSNGNTEDALYVWGSSVPYLKSVSSEYDTTNKKFNYEQVFNYDEISNKLNNAISSDTVFNILSKNNGGRVISLEVNGVTYGGVEFRKLLNLRSTDFYITNTGNEIKISTKGYGHGVGMSQYGANGMANNGYDYISILKHYYSGITIKD